MTWHWSMAFSVGGDEARDLAVTARWWVPEWVRMRHATGNVVGGQRRVCDVEPIEDVQRR